MLNYLEDSMLLLIGCRAQQKYHQVLTSCGVGSVLDVFLWRGCMHLGLQAHI
jgi:hypothetical protein